MFAPVAVNDTLGKRLRSQAIFNGQLSSAKRRESDSHRSARAAAGPFELPDPDEDICATIQRIVDNEVKHVPVR
jgi:hypothetical protein